ncbi:hypothetical protein JTB14_020663 [Gonioctena quinquepunctata]|nr:hypothetical protein JTB14_020663 [Gonioctena quinquepunctata]
MYSVYWVLAAVFVFFAQNGFCGVSDGPDVLVSEEDSKENEHLVASFGDGNRTDGGILKIIDHILGEEQHENELFVEESRKKKKNKGKEEKGLMEKMLPMMVTPFMVSTTMIPMMLVSMFFMLVKSALMGKIGIILMLINMFRNRSNQGGVMTHHINARDEDTKAAMSYYGYQGDEEYGAYISRRRKREGKFS